MNKRNFAVTLLAGWIGLWAGGNAHAAATTNFSDQWWVPSEAGWGASVHQQDTILFIDLFVYGPDNKPLWFVAAATLDGASPDGHTIFSGDLYQTSGPHFAGPFDPSAVTETSVGTLVFNADSPTTATLFYSVNGTNVSKAVTRQFWATENFTGSYMGGVVRDFFNCTASALNGHSEEPGIVSVAQSAGNAMTVTFDSSDGMCTFDGPYSQSGHVGSVQGTYSCTQGVGGGMVIFEMEKTQSSMSARMAGADAFCEFTGRIGGLKR